MTTTLRELIDRDGNVTEGLTACAIVVSLESAGMTVMKNKTVVMTPSYKDAERYLEKIGAKITERDSDGRVVYQRFLKGEDGSHQLDYSYKIHNISIWGC